MTDEELVRDFEAGRVPPGGFHHAQHVRVAWHYLRAHGLATALVRFTTGLRAFAAAQGKPDLYHETITTAFMLVIAERLGEPDAPATWDAFAERNPDLLTWKPSVLDGYYLPETLWSERARRSFVMPDRRDGAGVAEREPMAGSR
jgi:anti-sigma factor ChrR (cupin superfamily)